MSLREHGKGNDKYDNVRIGMNSRLDTIQAAILLEKLLEFPDELERRNRSADYYSEKLGHKYLVPTTPAGYTSSWAQYTLRSEFRDRAMEVLQEAGIPAVVYYGKCLHQQSVYSDMLPAKNGFPVAEKMAAQVFSLPMHAYLAEEIDDVVSALL